jgi:predicted amino acid dehydrogenase
LVYQAVHGQTVGFPVDVLGAFQSVVPLLAKRCQVATHELGSFDFTAGRSGGRLGSAGRGYCRQSNDTHGQ